MIELAAKEMRGSCTIIAGVGSNDTRHAVKLTERATERRASTRCCRSTRTTTGPPGAGSSRHYREVVRATDLPILLYNIPQRTGSDMPNDLLAELAQLDHIVGVKQANAANLAKVDGMVIYAGNDDLLADVLDLGEPGGILTASHIFGEEMHRMVDEPEHRREIDAALQDVYRDMAIAPAACSAQGGAEHDRRPGRQAAPALRRARRRRARGRARPARAPRHARERRRERQAPCPAARRPGRDRQEHDRRRVRRADRRRRHRAAVPDHRHARDRPRAAGLRLSARARRGHRGDRHHARPRGPSRCAAVGAARAERRSERLRLSRAAR